MNTKVKSNIWGFLLFAIAVFADQIAKMLAVSVLKGNAAVSIIPRVFELQYLENHGAAFGLFQNRQIIFVVIAAVILIAGIIFYQNLPADRRFLPLKFCTVCIAAGALGNMIDRVRIGYVVDFFYFSLIDFPIFNVADIYVTVATALLVVLVLFYYKEEDFKYFSFKPGANIRSK